MQAKQKHKGATKISGRSQIQCYGLGPACPWVGARSAEQPPPDPCSGKQLNSSARAATPPSSVSPLPRRRGATHTACVAPVAPMRTLPFKATDSSQFLYLSARLQGFLPVSCTRSPLPSGGEVLDAARMVSSYLPKFSDPTSSVIDFLHVRVRVSPLAFVAHTSCSAE